MSDETTSGDDKDDELAVY